MVNPKGQLSEGVDFYSHLLVCFEEDSTQFREDYQAQSGRMIDSLENKQNFQWEQDGNYLKYDNNVIEWSVAELFANCLSKPNSEIQVFFSLQI